MPELSPVLIEGQSAHPGPSQALAETRRNRQDPRCSGRADPSLPSRIIRSSDGIPQNRTKTKDGARSNPGGARRVRAHAGQSPHQIGTDAGVRVPEAVEEATTATMIWAIGHPTGADPAVDPAVDPEGALAIVDDEARHQGKTQLVLEGLNHPRPLQEAEEVLELEDCQWMDSADLPRD